MLYAKPDLKIVPVRGNVPTRLRKLDESNADAIVLARAGLVRLNLMDRPATRLDPAEFLPACGQGALGIETREDNTDIAKLLEPLNDVETNAAVTVERTFLSDMGGGCQAPFGAYARYSKDQTMMDATAIIASLDGKELIRQELSCPASDDPETIGRQLADRMRKDGCMEILDKISAATGDQKDSLS